MEKTTNGAIDNNGYSSKLHDVRWQKKKNTILMRDNYKCRCCGDTRSFLHVHHLKYIKKDGTFVDPWDYPDDMLITLCEHCHNDLHGRDLSKEEVDKYISTLFPIYKYIEEVCGAVKADDKVFALSNFLDAIARSILSLSGHIKKILFKNLDIDEAKSINDEIMSIHSRCLSISIKLLEISIRNEERMDKDIQRTSELAVAR